MPGPIALPEIYYASTTFIDANLEAGQGSKTAIAVGDHALSYSDVAALTFQTGNALKKLGVQMEQRVMIVALDSPEFAACFFGAIRIGAVPIPMNTLLKSADYEYLLNDSRARGRYVESGWNLGQPGGGRGHADVSSGGFRVCRYRNYGRG